MPIEIEGVAYYSAAEVCRELHLTRQTLWRWRQDRKVPTGRRYRNHQLLFTSEEMAAIRQYANRLEPADPPVGIQMKLFTASSPKRNAP